jgi:hypothetical protein
MKSTFTIIVMLTVTLFSTGAFAGVYKCSDDAGNTSYQSTPCAKEKKTVRINIRTGGKTDISAQEQEMEIQEAEKSELDKQQESEQQRLTDMEIKRISDASAQSALNQQLIKNNPIQFSAYAIPPYKANDLPALVKQFEARLPEIEKFRRLTALKALSSGNCHRVEADNLSIKSTLNKLVFSVDCSSAKTFYFNETELLH